MKKIYVLLMILLLCCSVAVFAKGSEGSNKGASNSRDSGNGDSADEAEEDEQPRNNYVAQQQHKNSLQVEEQAKVNGLENAMLRVRNEEVQKHLEQVLNKIQEKKRQRLSQLEDLVIEETFEGDFEAEGNQEGKFLGIFKAKKKMKYQIGEDGEIAYKPGPWDFLWQFQEGVANETV